jgi:predicted Zn-dependent protease
MIKRAVPILLAEFLCFLTLFLTLSGAAQAQKSPSVIRDTEIEAILKEWSAPLVAAAGMDAGSVNFVIVQDPQVNAFVAGGANIFLYTGLIEKTRNPDELMGVIAHELGHIRSGHLIRTRQALENASYESMLGTILGIGAAILTGDGGAASAVALGTQASATTRFLTFSRIQESSADQAALEFLKAAQEDPRGFLTFMEQLESQELLPASQQSEYIRTHPLTRDRIDAIRKGVTTSPYHGKAGSERWAEQHARFLAKLTGFITPEKIGWAYDDRDQSVAARYARTIAAYRESRVDKALEMIDTLVNEEPQNPYFHELRGQMLMDFGRLEPAKVSLRRAIELNADAPLIRIMYAQALIESSNNGVRAADVQEAITQLNRAMRDEPRSPMVHRLLATAYGYRGMEAEAKLHLAEEAVLQRRFSDAKRLAESASGQLKQGSRSWIRAQDVLSVIQQADKDNKSDNNQNANLDTPHHRNNH